MAKRYDWDDDVKEGKSFLTSWITWIVAIMLVLGAGGYVLKKGTNVADNVLDNAIANYEQFQEIYNTCLKINTDLGIYKPLPENDKMFEQFSKVQRIAALKTQLNRWVEEYNAKSRMWNKSLWKSQSLPYQLTCEQFSNY